MMTWIRMIVMTMMILKLKDHRLPFHHQGPLPLQIEGIMKKFDKSKSAKEHTQRTSSSIWTDSCTVWSQLQLKHPSSLNTFEYHDDLRPPTSFAIRRGRLHALCNAYNKCFMKCFHIWFILTCNECLWKMSTESTMWNLHKSLHCCTILKGKFDFFVCRISYASHACIAQESNERSLAISCCLLGDLREFCRVKILWRSEDREDVKISC